METGNDLHLIAYPRREIAQSFDFTFDYFILFQTKKRKNNNPEILYMGCNLTNVYVNKHQGCHRVAIYHIRYVSGIRYDLKKKSLTD